ncbi:MAG: caspase family protein [Deltaproteobacteria bacterium]|nr:caspase family protein [Deltaproteobacteria bacterium]
MTKRALCVGINRFTDRELPPLKGAVNDARTLSLMLMRDFGFDPRNVLVLANEQATRAALLSSIGALLEGSRPGDELVLFASTHGSHVPDQDGDDEDGYDEVLVAHDHDWERGVLSDDELARALARAPQGVRLTTIWDTCHAGTMQDTASAAYRTRSAPRGLAEGVELLGPRYVPLPERYDVTRGTKAARKRPAKASTRKKKKPPAGAEHGAMGALLHDGFPAVSLGACSDDETSADASFGGIYEGAFSHAMLDVLRRTRDDLTWEELHARTRALMTRLGIKQTPQIHVPEGRSGAPVFGGRARRAAATAEGATELASVEREITAHEQAGRWAEAVAACWRRAALVTGAAEKVRTIEHVVSIHRAVLRDEAAALRATEEVLRIDPAHAGALAYLRSSGGYRGTS